MTYYQHHSSVAQIELTIYTFALVEKWLRGSLSATWSILETFSLGSERQENGTELTYWHSFVAIVALHRTDIKLRLSFFLAEFIYLFWRARDFSPFEPHPDFSNRNFTQQNVLILKQNSCFHVNIALKLCIQAQAMCGTMQIKSIQHRHVI